MFPSSEREQISTYPVYMLGGMAISHCLSIVLVCGLSDVLHLWDYVCHIDKEQDGTNTKPLIQIP